MAPVPVSVLRELAPSMTDAAELVVTLYAVEAISRVRRYPRRLRLSELRSSRALVQALDGLCPGRSVETAFADGVRAALNRGSLLCERAAVALSGGRRSVSGRSGLR